jgi:hypothetical protein
VAVAKNTRSVVVHDSELEIDYVYSGDESRRYAPKGHRGWLLNVRSLDHEHFEVRPHHLIDTKRLCDSVKLVQIQPAASSCLDERFQDDIHSHLVTESEAIDDGTGHTSHLDSLPLDAMLLDSKSEQRSRNPCYPQRWI